MQVLLVRHARSWKRSRWGAAAELRPLSADGREQASRLVDRLAAQRIERILSSPHLRCRETVAPLAAARGLRVEVDRRLAEGERPEKACALLRELAARPTLLCSHGDVVAGILAELEVGGARIEDPVPGEKGSAWLLAGPDPARIRARYLTPPATRPVREDVLRFAVLDLGSTSFHLVVVDVDGSGSIRRVARERVMLRLGAALARPGGVPPELVRRAVATARRLARVAQGHGAAPLLAVATAALRHAANGAELSSAIARAIGAPVRVLSGRQEARLIFAAFRHQGDLLPGTNLGLDLGGGSLELALGSAREIRFETTLPLGAALLTGEDGRGAPFSERQRAAIRARVAEALRPHARRIRAARPRRAVAAGGSVRALARLVAHRRGLGRGASGERLEILRGELEQLAFELAGSSHAERLRLPGMQPERADLLPAAALVLEGVAHEFELPALRVSDWGLREGVVLEALRLASA